MELPDADRMRQILASLPGFVVIIDRERKYRWVNRLDPTLRPEDLAGKGSDEFIHPDYVAAASAAIERAFVTGEVTEYITCGYGQGAHKSWYRTRVVPLPSGDLGERALLLSTDITDQHLAEDALRASEGRLRQLIEASPDLNMIVDRDFRIVYMNRDPLPELAVTRKDIVGMDALAFVEERDRPTAHRAMTSVFETGQPTSYEVVGLVGDGPYVVRVLPLGDEVLVVATDVSLERRVERERAELEARLQQSQKMQSLGQLAGGVAHDFHNLLLVIRAHLDLADVALVEGADPRADHARIRAAMERLQGLTSRLLAVARRHPHQPVEVDLAQVVRQTVGLFERVTQAHVRIELDLPDERLSAIVDPAEIEQVLLNLCLNARDAIDGPGRIRVSVDRLEPRDAEDERGRWLRVTVADTGAGMTEETLEQIFEPFFTTKPAGRGTGLGLSMVYSLVSSNGGCVQAKSDVGRGTTMTFWLPAADPASLRPAAPPVAAAPRRGATETILVVEDEPMVREAVRRMLEKAGYRVIEAEGGRAALDVVRERGDEVDLVLLDAVMHDLSGKDVFEQARVMDPTLRVVMTSGYAADVVDEGWLERMQVVLLPKPYGAETLLEVVRRALGTPRG